MNNVIEIQLRSLASVDAVQWAIDVNLENEDPIAVELLPNRVVRCADPETAVDVASYIRRDADEDNAPWPRMLADAKELERLAKAIDPEV